MKDNHLNPQQAFDEYKQRIAKRMMPIHYGTLVLSDELLDESLHWIKLIAEKNPNEIYFLNVGEVLTL